MRKLLIQAGKIESFSPNDMLATCFVSAFLWALTGWYFVFMEVVGLWVVYLAAPFGLIFPMISLKSFIAARQRKLIRGLPFSIDLLALSMEAGLDFTTALQRICDRQRGTPIGEELGEMLRLIKYGRTRRDALRDLAERLDLDDVTSFCNSLIQADELGTPIGQVLTVQSEQLRAKRFQRAEELAGKAPVKILFPLVVFIMPTVFIVLFGPIILSAKDAQ